MALQSTNHLPLLLLFHKGGNMTVIRLDWGVHPYLERHLAHPRPSLYMHMHGLKQSRRCAVRASPARMREHPVLTQGCKTEQGEPGVEPGPLAAPAECFLTSLQIVLPHGLPVPHAVQKKCFLKIFQRHTASFYWNYYRDQSCHESTSADHWDSNAVSTGFFILNHPMIRRKFCISQWKAEILEFPPIFLKAITTRDRVEEIYLSVES